MNMDEQKGRKKRGVEEEEGVVRGERGREGRGGRGSRKRKTGYVTGGGRLARQRPRPWRKRRWRLWL